MTEGANCYVYEIIVDGVVRYIGKGTSHRYRDHINLAKAINRKRADGQTVKAQRFHNRLARSMREGAEVGHRIVVSGLTSSAALEREVAEIAAAPAGQLWNEQPGGQGADAEHFRRNWQDPDIRARMLAAHNSPDALAAQRARAVAQWSDEEARERNRARTKAHWEDPEIRAVRIAALRAAAGTEERRAATSRATKALWADPERSARIREATAAAARTEEARRKRSERSKAMWAAEGARERYGPAISRGQKASGKLKALWLDPEHREKQRQARIAGWVKRKANST